MGRRGPIAAALKHLPAFWGRKVQRRMTSLLVESDGGAVRLVKRRLSHGTQTGRVF